MNKQVLVSLDAELLPVLMALLSERAQSLYGKRDPVTIANHDEGYVGGAAVLRVVSLSVEAD